MIRRLVDSEDPDRLYTVTGGRSRAGDTAFDLVTLVTSRSEPTPGMQSEHVRILRVCRAPTAVVELSADLKLPVSIVKILLSDLLERGRISARHPSTPNDPSQLPDPAFLKQVLVGLQKL
ncbi:DUF742 domain-containing protein [Frankia sp. Mgl5]|uniref:DUF742 domain-containing protein n=1 Tax=Parafrankia soli TaxID=2599596 RepID=A0A1S1R197_9ACTN|nr:MULTISPECIES: DUF742 domain-containing protein [Frankiaceae]CAI7975162.1 conserved hypothetical protein [Frankia sp. Hr75.2]MCK9930463.1 DUF742 domain-containing protein [Frankia sp. Mgl5]OHV39666.1 hypothetical protein BBK14_13375 [Parafrankia soli]TCJ36677.1 DUF742 domain-containing protein [Parafrankia sp. BMG5.11]SQD97076.1 conserved hypothetical protein [Parafrankia sp. Ea1.12]